MADVTTSVSVDGAAAYKAKMAELKSAAQRLDSEMALLTSTFDQNTSAQEKNQAQQEQLEKRISNQQAIVDTIRGKYAEMTAELDRLAEAAQQAAAEHGENSEEARKAEAAYSRHATATNKVATELNKAEAALNNMKAGMTQVGDEADKSKEKVSLFGDVLKAKLSADFIEGAVKGIVGAIAGVAKAIGQLVLDSAAYADEILTLSSTTGIGTDALQEYRYMAELTDVSLETITGSQTKLIKSMASAKAGGKAAAEAFAALGVAVTDADGGLRNADDVFLELLTALGEIPNETERDAAAMELFGKSARELNPLIEAGADSLEAFRKEAHDVGYVLDNEQLSALGRVDDGWQRLQKRFEGVKNQLGSAMAPAAEAVFKLLEKIVNQIDWEGLAEYVNEVADSFSDWVGNIDIEDIINQLSEGAEQALKFFENMNKVFALFEGRSILTPFKVKEDDVASGMVKELAAALGEAEDAAASGALADVPDQLSSIAAPAEAAVTGLEAAAAAITSAVDTFQATEDSASDASSAIDDFAEAMAAAGKTGADAATEPIKEAVELMADLPKQADGWGRDFMSGFARGISQNKHLVLSEVSNLADAIKALFHFSRPDKGPLREYERWMPDFMAGLASGIRDNTWQVQEAADNAANAIAAGILLNRQMSERVANPTADYSEIIQAISEAGANSTTQVVLEGDARQIFRAVRTENNRVYRATGYNQLGRR